MVVAMWQRDAVFGASANSTIRSPRRSMQRPLNTPMPSPAWEVRSTGYATAGRISRTDLAIEHTGISMARSLARRFVTPHSVQIRARVLGYGRYATPTPHTSWQRHRLSRPGDHVARAWAPAVRARPGAVGTWRRRLPRAGARPERWVRGGVACRELERGLGGGRFEGEPVSGMLAGQAPSASTGHPFSRDHCQASSRPHAADQQPAVRLRSFTATASRHSLGPTTARE